MARPSRLTWTAPALDDLDDIAAWIADDDPDAARDRVERVLRGVEQLRRHPESGRRVPEAPGGLYRERILAPCRVIYRREGSNILIVNVMRGERLLSPRRLR